MSEWNVYHQEDFVRFYDWSYAGMVCDIPFYIDLAREHGGPVLEAACGSGRVTVALAREGFATVGLDLSEPMLALARERLASEAEEVRARVTLLRADMQQFDLDERFAVVLVPNASVFHLHSNAALLRCFEGLRTHTCEGGMAVVDVVAPEQMRRQREAGACLVGEGVNPLTGLYTQEYNRVLSINRSEQTVRVEHVYVEEDGESAKRYAFEQAYRWLEKEEGMELLREAGFGEIDVVGDYGGAAYTSDSPRLILVAGW